MDAKIQKRKEQKYINRIVDRFDINKEKTKEAVEKIRKFANEYVLEKINKG